MTTHTKKKEIANVILIFNFVVYFINTLSPTNQQYE